MAAVSNLLMKKRILFLLALFFCITGILVFRLIWVQFIRSEFYHQKALENRLRSVPVEPKRGTIYDRNGKELAVSASADTLIAIPAEIKKPREIARLLAPVLGMEEEKLYKNLTKRSALVYLRRKLPAEISEKIKHLSIDGKPLLGNGIEFTEEGKRYYPKGKLASHVLGITGIDSQGLEGIEFAYDQVLRGTMGRIEGERDALGKEIPNGVKRYVPPEDGKDIYLTIDEVVQYIAERELSKVVRDKQLKSGTIIVVKPKTGEVLAMASYPDFDPNNYNEYPASNRRNLAISDNYEPGSTFKIVTASAALEENVVTDGDRFTCGGSIKVPGGKIRCHKPQGHGTQTFAQVVQNSCNPGFVTIGLYRLGTDKFFKYVHAFGFGEKTKIDLPGEAKGIVRKQDSIKPIELATMSIGQGIAVTPIQLIMAASAVANGGVLLEPQLVREIRDSKTGKVIQSFEPKVVRQAISTETSAKMCAILESVVEEGTGKRAFLEGYRVAGKTGTAQKVGPTGGYIPGKYVASFVGFAPANDPQIAVLVVLDEPKGEYYGGLIAAPVFQAVVKDVMQHLGIKPQFSPDGEEEQQTVVVPEIRNLPRAEAELNLRKIGLLARIEGEGEVVIEQTPKPGALVSVGTKIILYMNSNNAYTGNFEVTVPNLIGKSMREAGRVLAIRGLKMIPYGSGIAVRQNPAPGTQLKTGMTVKVEFSPIQ